MNGWRPTVPLDLKVRPSLRQNLVLLFSCFVFAVILWIYVVGSDPNAMSARPEMREYNDVPLIHNRSAAFDYVAPAVSAVTVTLRGRFLPDNPVVRASVDVSHLLTAGLHRLPVIVETIPEGNYTAAASPESVSTFVDTLQSRATPVSFVGIKEPQDEYLTGSPALDPDTVTVTGPASLVARAHAVVSWDLSHATANIDTIVPVRILGVAGSEQHLLKLSPDRVRLFIPVHRQRAYAVVPVNPDFAGTLAPGYTIVRAEVRPPVLTVSGAPGVIAGLRSVSTADIDVSDLTRTTTRRAPLALPAGVRSESGATVSVHIQVAAAPPPAPLQTTAPSVTPNPVSPTVPGSPAHSSSKTHTTLPGSRSLSSGSRTPQNAVSAVGGRAASTLAVRPTAAATPPNQ